MHPCDARQVPSQLRHGEPVTEGQRSSGGAAAAPPASRRIIGTPITTLSDPSPPSGSGDGARRLCIGTVRHCQGQHCRLAGRERSVGADHQQAGCEQRGGGGPGLGDLPPGERGSGEPVSSHRGGDGRNQCPDTKIHQSAHGSGRHRLGVLSRRDPGPRADHDRPGRYATGSGGDRAWFPQPL